MGQQAPRSAASWLAAGWLTARPPGRARRYPWERGEEAWLLLGKPPGTASHADAGTPSPGALSRGLAPSPSPSAPPSAPRQAPPRWRGCLGSGGGGGGGSQGEKEAEDAAAEEEDLPAGALADADSKFLTLGGLSVHYKEALPPVRARGAPVRPPRAGPLTLGGLAVHYKEALPPVRGAAVQEAPRLRGRGGLIARH